MFALCYFTTEHTLEVQVGAVSSLSIVWAQLGNRGDNALDGCSRVDVMIVRGCMGTFSVQDFNLLFEIVTQICRDDS